MSLFKGEPKQPMNAFNFFIKKLSTERKVDFKTAVKKYRDLSKEEKDVYIEMSRKAKIQYKHDLATYLFSLPPDEQTQYLTKLDTPKRTRIKKEKVVNPKSADDVDYGMEESFVNNNDFEDESILPDPIDPIDSIDPMEPIEVIATQDSADFDEAVTAGNKVEVMDVFTIKTEVAETHCDTSVGNDRSEKSTESLENSKIGADESSVLNKSEQETPRKHDGEQSSTSDRKERKRDKKDKKKHKQDEEIADDEQSSVCSVAFDKKEKKRDKSHNRKRKHDADESGEQSTDHKTSDRKEKRKDDSLKSKRKNDERGSRGAVEEKKIKVELDPPERAPS